MVATSQACICRSISRCCIRPWNARTIATLIDAYEAALPAGGWPNWVLGNHDRARIASRVGDAQARIAAMLLLTLRGTPTIYYGDEIGMPQVPIRPIGCAIRSRNGFPGSGSAAMAPAPRCNGMAATFAGFSTVEPWLPVADCFGSRNVAEELQDPSSIHHLYRRLDRDPAATADAVGGQLP